MFNKQHIVRTIAATASILALSFTAACGSGQSTASNSADSNDITQQTYKPGKLTIATGQPAYEPWVMNDKPESGEGYEAAVAYAVADKLGFKKSDVVWTRTAFDTAIAPGAKDWDFNIQQFGITDERKKSWDFSTPYRTDYVGLMVKKRSGFTSIEDLDGKVIGVSQGATTQGLIEQMIKDNGFSCKPEFRAFSGYPIIKSSLDAGNIDVFAMDRSTLAGYMNETVELLQPEVKFGEQGYGVATKKGCDLSAVVDQVICDRLADGWLDQEVKTWGLV